MGEDGEPWWVCQKKCHNGRTAERYEVVGANDDIHKVGEAYRTSGYV